MNLTARTDLENKITIFAPEQHNDTESAQHEQPQLVCTETSSKVCRSPHPYLYSHLYPLATSNFYKLYSFANFF